jgi:hypothetical protein
MFRASCLAVLAAVLLIACGEDPSEPSRPRTIVVSDLTMQQIRERALAALDVEGQVFHVTTTDEGARGTTKSEAWVDYERDLARVESGDELRVVYERHMALLFDGRFRDAIIDSPAEKVAPLELHYIRWLFDDAADLRGIEEAVVDGEPAIRVRLERDMYEYDARESAAIDLSEGFLPLRAHYSTTISRFPDASTEFVYEFVARDSLPATFFTPEDVQAAAAPVVEPLREARAAGLAPYWLGEQFEETVLRDDSRFDPGTGDSGPMLRLQYGAPGQDVAPSPCIMIREYTRDAWDELVERAREENPDSLLLLEPDESIDVPAGEALLFFGPGPPALPTPRISGPAVTPDPDAVPPPGAPPPLPVVLDDTGASLEARFIFDATVVEVDANCGPPGSNLYRTRDAFTRVLQSLRPFDEP